MRGNSLAMPTPYTPTNVMMQNENSKQLYKSLLKDYEDALYQLAEARLHIDRLRFGAQVDIKKHYRLTHSNVDEAAAIHSKVTADVIDANGQDELLSEGHFQFQTTDTAATRRSRSSAAAAAVKQINDLQRRVVALHEKTQFSEISLDEVKSELLDIHQMHQRLSTSMMEGDDINSAENTSIKDEV